MKSLTFKIRGMDCAEEIAALRATTGKVDGVESLDFDLLKGTMKVTLNPGAERTAEILKAIRASGLDGAPVDPSRPDGAGGVRESAWPWRGRLALLIASALFTAAGLLSHAVLHGGIVHALAAGEIQDAHRVPPLAMIFYVAAILSGGWFIFPKAVASARRWQPDMNLLMTVAAIGAMAIGQWFEAATVTFLFAAALLLEAWSVRHARRAIGTLLDLSPQTARVLCPHDGDVDEKRVEDVGIGSTVVVRPGERIPLDGIVLEGATRVNQAPITGESRPVAKKAGDEVLAGTINGDGAITFRVTKPASDTTLARIIRMVEEAQARRAPVEQWVNRFARRYTPAMMLVAIAVAVIPPLVTGGDWSRWLYEGLVMLVIACPCALVISTPVSIAAALTTAARRGILIKGGAYLEIPARLKAIAVDKTGTLTYGRPAVQTVVPLDGHTEDEVAALAAGIEAFSEHPLARAIIQYAGEKRVTPRTATSFQAMPGRGAEARIDGRQFWIGSHRLMHELEIESASIHEQARQLEDAGHSVVAVGGEHHVWGLISISDGVRPHTRDTIESLFAEGVQRVIMLTGDNEETARDVAAASGVSEYHAELLPEDKASRIHALVKELGDVAMIGDGVNDAPAMAAATLSIAMGANGTDVAIETADVTLMTDDLARIPWLIRHSRRTMRVIRQNIAFALATKAVFMILALAGVATLWMAIAADMGASLLVLFNGLRLLKGGR